MFTITVGRLGEHSRKTRTLSAREITLGRDSGSDVVLEDEVVSRTHCRLVAIAGGALLLDEGSRNGTWLNGKLVERPELVTFDDELVIGPYTLRIQSLVGRCTTGHTLGQRDPPWAHAGALPVPA
jgi:pSer/pThr/pTyr-binding forkhead associated (FHA) protein